MKLNNDCMRDALLFLEKEPYIQLSDDEKISFEQTDFDYICENLPKHNKEDVYYALFNMCQAELISMEEMPADNVIYECYVEYITFKGHEFLEKIRDDTRWGTIKKITGAMRNYSLSAISSIAEGVTAGAISKLLNDA